MPDGFALAALSYALRTRIQQSIADAADVAQTGQFDVVSRAPDQLASSVPTKPTLTVYPWRLLPNPSWDTSRGVAYAPTGERRANALLALDAFYVVAGYAKDDAAVESVLGLALLGLHETPQLSRALLQAMAGGVFPAGSPLPQSLRDLADQPAPLSVEIIPYELEAFSQVWSTFHSGVRTGLIYRVGTLLMESRRRAATAPPVREGRLSVTLLRAPRIERMSVAATAAGPFAERPAASPADVLRIEGAGLKGDITSVMVGAEAVAVDPERLWDDRIEIDLPATLRPGLVTVQIRQDWPKPAGRLPPHVAGTIPGERSNLVPLAIRPMPRPANPFTIANRQVGADGEVSFDVTVHLSLPIGNHQRGELMLNALLAGGDGRFASYAFTAPHAAPGVPEADMSSVAVPISGVAAGTYLVRFTVDGAESALNEDGTGVTGPTLTVPA